MIADPSLSRGEIGQDDLARRADAHASLKFGNTAFRNRAPSRKVEIIAAVSAGLTGPNMPWTMDRRNIAIKSSLTSVAPSYSVGAQHSQAIRVDESEAVRAEGLRKQELLQPAETGEHYRWRLPPDPAEQRAYCGKTCSPSDSRGCLGQALPCLVAAGGSNEAAAEGRPHPARGWVGRRERIGAR